MEALEVSTKILETFTIILRRLHDNSTTFSVLDSNASSWRIFLLWSLCYKGRSPAQTERRKKCRLPTFVRPFAAHT